MRGFTFDHPGNAPLLALVILVIGFLYVMARHHRRVSTFLGSALSLPSKRRTYLHSGLLCMTWLAAVVTLMEPKGNPHPLGEEGEEEIVEQTVTQTGDDESVLARRQAHDLIFLVDASASMEVADTRQGESRLNYAKEIVDQIVGGLDGQSASLYAFTSEVTPVVPATLDYLYLRLLLRRVGINEGDVAGTDLLEALDYVSARHKAPQSDKAVTLVLLTDGGDTGLEEAQGADREQALEAILSRVSSGNDHVQTYCIGLGSHQGEVIPNLTYDGESVCSTLDEELLSRLAERGGGEYYFANEHSALSLANHIVANVKRRGEEVATEQSVPKAEVERYVSEKSEIGYDRYFRIPLLMATLALAVHLLVPRRKS